MYKTWTYKGNKQKISDQAFFFIKQGETIVQGFILNAKLKSLIFWPIFGQKSADFCKFAKFANFDKMAINPFAHLKMRLIFGRGRVKTCLIDMSFSNFAPFAKIS